MSMASPDPQISSLNEDEDPSVVQEKVINEEYKVWKKNAPYLYDLVVTHSLEWPSLTVQWFPEIEEPEGKNYTSHRLLMGTHTSGEEQEFLQILTVQLPKTDLVMDASKFDEDRKEFGGYGSGGQCKINVTQKIPHDGEVNRARLMPHNCTVIATRTVSGEVHIFDYTRHPSNPPSDSTKANPELRCLGLKGESYGLAWSPKRQGWLASCSTEPALAYWDVMQGDKENRVLRPIWSNQSVHQVAIEDVSWHESHEHVLGSVGEDGMMCLWDVRQDTPAHTVTSIKADTFCLAFNPINEHLIVSGNADRGVVLWDMRNLSSPTHVMEGHQSDVLQVAWSPHHEHILASSSSDRRVNVWDLSRIGAEQSAEDAEDGPPELLFMHGGHCNRIPDLSWNRNLPWVLATVAEDNIVQVWQMACEIYEHEGDTDNESDEEADVKTDQDHGMSVE